MKKILVLNSYYLPGFKGGGPVKSIKNIVDNLNNEYEFYIITSDRDLNDTKTYDGIDTNVWLKRENYNIFYLNANKDIFKNMKNAINSIEYEFIYLNGYFSPKFTIIPLLLRKFGLLSNEKVLISARGDFSEGHLKIKYLKKNLYIKLSKIIGHYTDVYWQAASDLEVTEIKKIMKTDKIIMAPNISNKIDVDKLKNKEKKLNDTKIVFISRISRKKNLIYALKILSKINVDGNIDFDIYGPKEDINYWKECDEIINKMPKNIHVNYCGTVKPENVNEVLLKYHAFLFPTHGENYGHVIVEAMGAGCIPILSNTTPWINLEKNNIGFDIALENEVKFIDAVKKIHGMDIDDFKQRIQNLTDYYYRIFNVEEEVNLTRNMFDFMLNE